MSHWTTGHRHCRTGTPEGRETSEGSPLPAWAGGNPNRVWGFLELREVEAAGAGRAEGKEPHGEAYRDFPQVPASRDPRVHRGHEPRRGQEPPERSRLEQAL